MAALAHYVGMNLTIESVEAVPADAITDLIELLVDELDEHGYAPTVRSAGEGVTFTMSVEVAVPNSDLATFEVAFLTIKKALAAAGLDTGSVRLDDLCFGSLQPV